MGTPEHRPVQLTAFAAEYLPTLRLWFDDAEVRRWLGGPDWIDRELRLRTGPQGGTFRGRTVLRAHAWVVLDEHLRPVGYVAAEVYDRWTTWRPDEVVATVPGPAAGLVYVIDRARRRQGYGRRALHEVLAHDELADVRVFACGVDADNAASLACARSAGFVAADPRPDHEDTVHLLRRR